MKKLFLALIVVLVLAFSAQAADITLQWDASVGATGYMVYISTDNGETWDSGRDTGSLTPNEQGDVSYIYIGAPDSGLTLLKVSAYNDHGESDLPISGAWHWSDMPQPPQVPGSAGIQDVS